jgi:DNA polymerase IIIc chi subunit
VIGSQNENKCDILLGTEQNDSSSSDFLISVNGALISREEISSYKRCALLFDDKNSDEMNIAREQWIEFSKADIRAKYWSQETGVWSLKREN